MVDEVEKYPQSWHSGLKVLGKEEERSSSLWLGLQLRISKAKAADCSGVW